MGNYFDLIAAINAAIKTNGEQGITGASLNAILRDMVAALGAGYQYVGVVAPDAAAPSTDYNAVYIALTAGTYTNFGGTQVKNGQFGVFTFNGSWAYNVADIASGGYVRYDVPQVMTQEQAARARSNIAAASNADVNAKYTKPDSGIPAADLAEAVQTSLGKADSALPASDVVDNLTTEDATKALSAKQGKVLDGKINQLGQELDESICKVGMTEISLDPFDIESNYYIDFSTSNYVWKNTGSGNGHFYIAKKGEVYYIKSKSGTYEECRYAIISASSAVNIVLDTNPTFIQGTGVEFMAAGEERYIPIEADGILYVYGLNRFPQEIRKYVPKECGCERLTNQQVLTSPDFLISYNLNQPSDSIGVYTWKSNTSIVRNVYQVKKGDRFVIQSNTSKAALVELVDSISDITADAPANVLERWNSATASALYDFIVPQDGFLCVANGTYLPTSIIKHYCPEVTDNLSPQSKDLLSGMDIFKQIKDLFKVSIDTTRITSYFHFWHGNIYSGGLLVPRNYVITLLEFSQNYTINFSLNTGYEFFYCIYGSNPVVSGFGGYIYNSGWVTITNEATIAWEPGYKYIAIVIRKNPDSYVADTEINGIFSKFDFIGDKYSIIYSQKIKDLCHTGAHSYIGEKIDLGAGTRDFDMATLATFPRDFTQSFVVYGNYILFFFGTKGYIFDISTASLVRQLTLTNNTHANTACIGCEFAPGNTDFPLIYISRCDSPGNCEVYDIRLDGTCTLVQTIGINYNDIPEEIRGSTYGDWVVDYDSGYIYSVRYRLNTGTNVDWSQEEYNGIINNTMFCKFRLPLMADGATITFTEADVKDSFRLQPMIINQDKFYKNGKMYISAGSGHPTYPRTSLKLYVVNLCGKFLESVADLNYFPLIEIEGCDCYGNDVLIADYDTYEVIRKLTFY